MNKPLDKSHEPRHTVFMNGERPVLTTANRPMPARKPTTRKTQPVKSVTVDPATIPTTQSLPMNSSATATAQAQIDQEAKLAELQAALASLTAQNEAQQATIQKLSQRKAYTPKEENTLTFVYQDMEPFIVTYKSSSDGKATTFNHFHECRRFMRKSVADYRANPNQDAIEFAQFTHKFMVDNAPNSGPADETLFEKLYNGSMKPSARRQSWDFARLYLQFMATFQEHVEAHDPFMQAIDQLRSVLSETNRGIGL